MEVEHEYENISFRTTQHANADAAGTGRDKLGKKPMPGPKPNYVAMKVAELNQQQVISSNGATLAPPLTKQGLSGSARLTPKQKGQGKKEISPKTTNMNNQANRGPQFENPSLAADAHCYDTAVRVKLDVLHQVSEDMAAAAAEKSASIETSTSPVSKSMPIYARPNKRPSIKEEPIYDEAIDVVMPPDDKEPVYEEAIVVDADRMKSNVTNRCPESEPLYADPDELALDQPQTPASHARYKDEDSSLYEEAVPVKTVVPGDEDAKML